MGPAYRKLFQNIGFKNKSSLSRIMELSQTPKSKKEYYDSLARKRNAVGILIFRGEEILIVKPSYSQDWLVPGRVVEKFESLAEATQRECLEEIGTKPTISRLLVVDYKKGDSEIGDAIHFLFEGQIAPFAEIHVDGVEIESFCWEPLISASARFNSHLSKRVVAAREAIRRDSTVYCEDCLIIC